MIDDPTQRKLVIDLAKKELDWEPTIVLDEGLRRTIESDRPIFRLQSGRS